MTIYFNQLNEILNNSSELVYKGLNIEPYPSLHTEKFDVVQ